MLLLLRLALRNLLRHRLRTGITTFAIVAGLGLMIVSLNLNDGVYSSMTRTGISEMAGHVVVQGEGYLAHPDVKIVVPDAAAVEAKLAQALPEAVIVSRVQMEGLITSPQSSSGAALNGIDPAREVLVSDWQGKVVEGGFIEGDRDILLGRALAENLDVKLGDKVVVMAQGEGEVISRLFRVKGLLSVGTDDIDAFLAIIHIQAAQELMAQPGAVTRVTAHLPSPETTEDATARARAALSEPGLEVLSWKQALPEVYELIQLDANTNHVFLSIIGFIVALGVLNTVLMSVMERVREFGVMMALGLTPGQIARLILLEGLVLGVVATTLGVLLGLALTYPLATHGLDYAMFTGESGMEVSGLSINSVIHANFAWHKTGAYGLGSLVMTVLASIYPAVRASKLRPVEAMRHV